MAGLRVAVVGGGWAGLAAAVAATRAGHAVTLLEAARQFGGRARRLELPLADGGVARVDNGQHILIGAYTQTLGLLRELGVDLHASLLRLPLTLRFPDGGGLALPAWPAPWDAAWGIATARGWSAADKLSLLRHAARWRLQGFRCDPALSVAQLCARLRPAVLHDLVEPLCEAALNTPAARAAADVFLRVLRDALFAPAQDGWGASNLLLPRVDLGALLPDTAVPWLQARGAVVRSGTRVQSVQRAGAGWQVESDAFDAVVLACPAWDAERLVAGAAPEAAGWLADVRALTHEAIATVYTAAGPRLAQPMLALRTSAAAPAQFVFDRSQLGGPAGQLAWVASPSSGDAAALQDRVVAQARALGWSVDPIKTVVEKRATFACTPGLRRPALQIAPGLLACGDYVEGPYPATLEGAVRAAQQAVQLLPAAIS